MKRFIKKDLIDKATAPQLLRKVDLNSKESLQESKDIDVGTEGKSFFVQGWCISKWELVFLKECWDFLVPTVPKIFEKSSLRHKITHAVASVVPATMINAWSISEKKMEKFYLKESGCLQKLLIKPKHGSYNYVLEHQKSGYKCSQVLTGTRYV